jgi:hypothetical protein
MYHMDVCIVNERQRLMYSHYTCSICAWIYLFQVNCYSACLVFVLGMGLSYRACLESFVLHI